MSWNPPAVRNAILALLNANAAGQFTVEGYQRESHGVDEITGKLRHVSTFYRSGDFDKSKSGWVAGPFKHAMTFAVELLLAEPASMDLTVLDPKVSATPEQRASALAASIEAGANADVSWDELAGLVFNILTDPVNLQLGQTAVVIADRWISNLRKSAPAPVGDRVVLSGTMDYTCMVIETPTGATPVPAGANAVDVTVNETADVTYDGTQSQSGKLDPAEQGAKSSP